MGVGTLTNLISLDLGQNDLTTLEDDFPDADLLSRYISPHFTPSPHQKKQLYRSTFILGPLKKLQFLVLNQNNLRVVPDAIVQLTSLYKVAFSNNQLTYLPASIVEIPNLKTLSIWTNPFDLSAESSPTRLEIPSLMELASLCVMAASRKPIEELRKLVYSHSA